LANFTLWAITVYLRKNKQGAWFLLTILPALFMTMVTGCFLFVAEKEGLGSILPRGVGYAIGAVITVCVLVVFLLKCKPVKNEAE